MASMSAVIKATVLNSGLVAKARYLGANRTHGTHLKVQRTGTSTSTANVKDQGPECMMGRGLGTKDLVQEADIWQEYERDMGQATDQLALKLTQHNPLPARRSCCSASASYLRL